MVVSIEGGQQDRWRWTAAGWPGISLDYGAKGIFSQEISTASTSRREWPHAGCQSSFASMHENRGSPVSLAPSGPVKPLAAARRASDLRSLLNRVCFLAFQRPLPGSTNVG